MYKLAVFDLDGTLLDTLDDLTASANYALSAYGYPTRTKAEIRSFIGDGIVKLMERSAGMTDKKIVDELIGVFRGHYAEHCKDATRAYAGINELLASLRSLGIKLAVLSNKVHYATQKLVADYFPDTFDEVMGENEAKGILRKPSPTALLAIIESLGVTKGETVYIGDSEVDIQTSRNAGVDCISVTWGFKDEKFLLDNGATTIVNDTKTLQQRILKNVEDEIGNTPIVKLENLAKEYALQADIYAKAEFLNVGGSIKDRVAKAMIDEAEQSGKLCKGGTVIEPTSGNTGIGLALVAKNRGYKAVIVMPDTMSVERQEMIKKYGGEVVLTDGKEGMQGAVKRAEEICKATPNSVIAGQFDNPANPQAHYDTTAPEIWKQLDGKVDIFVAGVGTGGTLTGVGKYLKERNPNVKIVAIEPASSPLLSKGEYGAHGVQGIGANFIPKVLDRGLIDEIICVTDEEAYAFAKALYTQENAFAGISSGANIAGAITLAKRAENAGKNIVMIFPDSGAKYLSSGLYE